MENKTDQENVEHKVKVINQISWFIPWLAGAMYTFGITGVEENFKYLSTLNVWNQVLAWIIFYFLWPITLGMHFAK